MTHLHNQKKAFKHIPYNFLNHGTCPQQTQVLSRHGYILVNIAQITVDIWQLQDQTQLLANVPNLMWTSGPEGGLCGGVPECMYRVSYTKRKHFMILILSQTFGVQLAERMQEAMR